MKNKITLSPQEIEVASFVGMKRATSSLIRKSKHTSNISRTDPAYDYHINGAMAEMAAAKFLGAFWVCSWDTWQSDGDLIGRKGTKIEVRWTKTETGHLLLKKDDPKNRVFILVTGTAPDFEIRGWIQGSEGMTENNWRKVTERPPSFFVSQSDLNPFKTKSYLKKVI